MTETKDKARIILSKTHGKGLFTKWKGEVADRANRKGTPDGYLLSESVSNHIFTDIPKPLQSAYQNQHLEETMWPDT
jgi:hypothetical protein